MVSIHMTGTINTSLMNLNASKVISSDVLKVTVQVILCWSECYNGKWQPTKTSDVNHPGELGQIHPTSFDRDGIGLMAFEDSHSSELRVSVGRLTFLLYNTHSLPMVDKEPPP